MAFSKKNFSVLVDADNVLWDLCSVWVNQLNKENGLEVDPKSIDCWEISKYFPTLTGEEMYAPLLSKELWESVKPIDGSVESLKYIFDNYDAYICTASCPSNFYLKYEYAIKRLFPFVDKDRVICASDKSMIKASVLIDDAPHNLEGYYRWGKILFTASHNKKYKEEYPIFRANTWEEALKILDNLFDERAFCQEDRLW